MRILDRLLEVAGEQRGYLIPDDARTVGVAPVELRKLAARGRLEHVAHGVYRLPTFPRRPNDELMAAVMWTRKRGVIGGQSALALFELCDVNPRRIDVTVPPHYRPTKQGGAHYRIRRAHLDPAEIEVVDDIPVVIPAIAIADAIEDNTDPRLVEQALGTARQRGELDTDTENLLRVQIVTGKRARRAVTDR